MPWLWIILISAQKIEKEVLQVQMCEFCRCIFPVKCTFVEISNKSDSLKATKVRFCKFSLCKLLDILFQKYIKIIKSICERLKIKSRKYCKQRRPIPELQIHLPFLIVLSVENISPLYFYSYGHMYH